MLSEPRAAPSEPVHLLNRMDMRDVLENDECLIVEMDNRPDLTDIRGALQGGLVATLFSSPPGGWPAATSGRHRTSRRPT